MTCTCGGQLIVGEGHDHDRVSARWSFHLPACPVVPTPQREPMPEMPAHRARDKAMRQRTLVFSEDEVDVLLMATDSEVKRWEYIAAHDDQDSPSACEAARSVVNLYKSARAKLVATLA